MPKLFYVIGASGAGKDTLINYARDKFDGAGGLIFAHRYITREPFVGNENHIHLTPHEFESRRSANLFSLWWESNGQQYAIGIEINQWLEKGFNVVVNGSRQYLPQARLLYPDMIVILIDADPSIIIKRLANRGRENDVEIENRMRRTIEIVSDFKDCLRIQNDGAVGRAGDELVSLLSS